MLPTPYTRLLITTTHNNQHTFPQAITGKSVSVSQGGVDNLVDYLGIVGE